MQLQRTILWIVFSMSLLFLWDNWQKHNGKPSMFGGPAATDTAAKAPAAGAAPASDGSIPTAPAAVATAPSAAAVPGAAGNGAAAPTARQRRHDGSGQADPGAQRRARPGHRPDRRPDPARRAAQAQGQPRHQRQGRGRRRGAAAERARPGLRRTERPDRRRRGRGLPDAQDHVLDRGCTARTGRRQRRTRGGDDGGVGRREARAHVSAAARFVRGRSARHGQQHGCGAGQADAVHAAAASWRAAGGRVAVLQHLHRAGRLHRREEVPEGRVLRHREGQARSREGGLRRLGRHHPALLRVGLAAYRQGPARVLQPPHLREPVRRGRAAAAGRPRAAGQGHRADPPADRAAGPEHARERWRRVWTCRSTTAG
jgi:hypothetical protein